MQQLVDRWNVFRPYYINSDCRNASLHLWACVQLFIQHIRLQGHSFSLIAYVLRGRKGTQRSYPKKKFMKVLKRSQASISEILYFWYLINAGFRKKEKNCRGAPGLNSIFNMWATWAWWRGLAWPSGTFASMTAPPEKILSTILIWKCVIHFLASKNIFLGFLSMVFQGYYHSCKVERFLIVSENQTKVIKTVNQKNENTFKS